MEDLFNIQELTSVGVRFECNIRIQPQHNIFLGHFPEQAIMPGVCMLEIISTVVSKLKQKKLVLRKSAQIKFLKPWLPEQIEEVCLSGEFAEVKEQIKMKTCEIKAKGLTLFKGKGFIYGAG